MFDLCCILKEIRDVLKELLETIKTTKRGGTIK